MVQLKYHAMSSLFRFGFDLDVSGGVALQRSFGLVVKLQNPATNINFCSKGKLTHVHGENDP